MPRRFALNAVLLAVVAVLAAMCAVLALRLGPDARADAGAHAGPMPRSGALEALTGVRVSRVAVVGDGGLVTVFYVVLDAEKASRFQADRAHSPRLSTEKREGGTQRTSIMRTSHQMRAGQTYYLVYQNTGGAVRPGEPVTLTYGGRALHHIPVL